MKTKKEEDKKKTQSFSIDPRVYEMWIEYCKENGIENYSSYIEKVIIDKVKNISQKKFIFVYYEYKETIKKFKKYITGLSKDTTL